VWIVAAIGLLQGVWAFNRGKTLDKDPQNPGKFANYKL
jgi:hypothetical protein